MKNNPGIALPGTSLLTLSSAEVSWLICLLWHHHCCYKSEMFISRLPGWGKCHLLYSVFPRSIWIVFLEYQICKDSCPKNVLPLWFLYRIFLFWGWVVGSRDSNWYSFASWSEALTCWSLENTSLDNLWVRWVEALMCGLARRHNVSRSGFSSSVELCHF